MNLKRNAQLNLNTDERARAAVDANGDATILQRYFHIERLKGDDAKTPTKYRASISSESPIKDYSWAPPYVLLHNKSAADLSRAEPNGLPLLREHDRNQIVGRITNLKLSGGRLSGDLVFSEATALARETKALVDDGTLTDMSGNFKINSVTRIEKEGQVERIDVTGWTIIEASVVSVPADASVGIGRQMADSPLLPAASGDTVLPAATLPATEETEMFRRSAVLMDPNPGTGGGNGQETPEQKAQREAQETLRRAQDKGHDAVIQAMELARVTSLRNIGKLNNLATDMVEAAVQRNMSVEEFTDSMLRMMEKRGKEKPQSRAFLDMEAGQVEQYSLVRAINAQLDRNWEHSAPAELEAHREIEKRLNRPPQANRFYVPMDVLRRQRPVDLDRLAQTSGRPVDSLRRDLNVATSGQGGYLTQTSIMSFDEILRNTSFAYRVGCRRLPGLRDNVSIPRQTAAATAAWLANETSTISESTPTFVQLLMSPKTVGAYMEISRQLLLQSVIPVENFVQQDIGAVVGLAVDTAVLAGSGASGQPTGLDNTSGIGSVTGTSLAFAGVLEFQTDVAGGNVRPVAGAYVTTPLVAALCIQRVKYTSTASPLWEGNVWEGTMQGFQAMGTNQVAASTMYFGDWDKAVIGEWGVLEIETNPFAGFTSGIIGIRGMYSVDVGIRYPIAFSKAASIT